MLLAAWLALGVGCDKQERNCAAARKAFDHALIEQSLDGLGDPETKATMMKELDARPTATDDELDRMFRVAMLGTRPGDPLPQVLLDRKAAYERACK
ncbi:MAG: hypothetical protein IT370_22910 [Deltaproteobacteria bacterium]|nr:hypothetical protein [Deltaproteobacteria bacterium]